jgi:ATP-dependent Clp protease adaptor protein ClpS
LVIENAMNQSSAAVMEPETAEPISTTQKQVETKEKNKPKQQPRYHVILWDDPNHTYDYVVRMMQELFGHSIEKGLEIATMVDKTGRAICLTTTKEHAELKRDQIHAYGSDPLSSSSIKGSMKASIEPDR